jgi:hypothetical protein
VLVPRACAFRPPLTDSRLAAIQNTKYFVNCRESHGLPDA